MMWKARVKAIWARAHGTGFTATIDPVRPFDQGAHRSPFDLQLGTGLVPLPPNHRIVVLSSSIRDETPRPLWGSCESGPDTGLPQIV